MIRRIKIALAGLLVAGGLIMAIPASVAAQDPFGGVDCGRAAGSAICTGRNNSGENPLTGPNGTLYKATILVARIAGVAAVIMMMWGGFKFMAAGGDPGKVGEAKNTIVYSLIGLVIIASSQFIILFVLSKI